MSYRAAIPLRLLTSLLVLGVVACSGEGPAGPAGRGDAPPQADIAAGHDAFVASCAGCHNSRDGLDLAYFGFPDSAIVRRAVKHVSRSTALDIAGYIGTLGPARADRAARPFQPGDQILGGDVELAIELFGADEWPADLTPEGLAAIDPRDVPVAFRLPRWSAEDEDTDWLSDVPIDEALLDWDPGSPALASARTYLDRYYVARGTRDLDLAVRALQAAVEARAVPDAPCAASRAGPSIRACFDARRWIASLAAQHLLRDGVSPVPESFHQAFWDVGNLMRRVDPADATISHVAENHAAWRYVGWLFDPSHERRSIGYPTGDLAALGLPRHAVFHSLRAMVVRPPESVVPYDDLREALSHAPRSWSYRVAKFGYEHLRSRLISGEQPRDPLYPRIDVDAVISMARDRVDDPAQLAELEALADDVRSRILAGIGS